MNSDGCITYAATLKNQTGRASMFNFLRESYRYWKEARILSRKVNCMISSRAVLMLESPGALSIGKGSSIGAGTVIVQQNYDPNKNGELIIGENTYIGENNNIRI